jgi:hypothetical protein
MKAWLPAAHLVLSLSILIWDVVIAGRIAQLRQASRMFAAVSGVAGLLLLPAVLVRIATSTFITGRAVVSVDWIWPLIVLLFALQAIYAIARHLVNPAWGIPIVVYDIVIASSEIVRYGVAHGSPVANHFASLLVAQTNTLAAVTTPIAVTTPFFFLVPIISPAYPPIRRVTAAIRAGVAALAFAWVILFVVIGVFQSPGAVGAHSPSLIHERPAGDFRVGLKIFPDVVHAPSAAVARTDLQLADTLDVRAVTVVIVPGAARSAIDSVGQLLDQLDDSITVIVALGYRGKLLPAIGHVPLDEPGRLTMIDYIVRKLHPNILLPAEDPLGIGSRLVGEFRVGTWEHYIGMAAAKAKSLDPRVRIGVSVSRFSAADSALYAWAATKGSPVDVVGFSFFPDLSGPVDSFEDAADRWMKTTPSSKDHWVFAAGAYPLNSGEATQQRVIIQTLAWATNHVAIKGLVVYEAADYAQARGLRAPSGRLRMAAGAVMRAIRELKESIIG